MPAEAERKLRQRAEKLSRQGKLHRKKGESAQEAKDRYVYGSPIMQLYRKKGK